MRQLFCHSFGIGMTRAFLTLRDGSLQAVVRRLFYLWFSIPRDSRERAVYSVLNRYYVTGISYPEIRPLGGDCEVVVLEWRTRTRGILDSLCPYLTWKEGVDVNMCPNLDVSRSDP